jgi:hypothetical protein
MHPVHLFLSRAHKLRASIPAPSLIDKLSLSFLLNDIFFEKCLQFSLSLIPLSNQLLLTFVLEELLVLLAINFGKSFLRSLPLHRLPLGIVHKRSVRCAIPCLIEWLASFACRRRTLLFGCSSFVN